MLSISNGLSIAEGYNIFANNLMFQERYGISSVLHGIFYNYPDEASRQEFYRTIILNGLPATDQVRKCWNCVDLGGTRTILW